MRHAKGRRLINLSMSELLRARVEKNPKKEFTQSVGESMHVGRTTLDPGQRNKMNVHVTEEL